jgi:hypothetical protein
MAVGSLARAPEHEVELVLDVLVADQAATVDVEVARRDRSGLSPDPCELTDGGFVEDGHSTSRSRRDPAIVGRHEGPCPGAASVLVRGRRA